MLTLFTVVLALAPATSLPSTSIEGRWVNPDHTVIVDIAPCAGSLCGTVQWATAQAQQDARRGVPNLIGTQILTGLQQDGGMWRGKLFVPDADLHGEGKIEVIAADQLKVEGCEFGICKSQVWSKAEGPLPPAE